MRVHPPCIICGGQSHHPRDVVPDAGSGQYRDSVFPWGLLGLPDLRGCLVAPLRSRVSARGGRSVQARCVHLGGLGRGDGSRRDECLPGDHAFAYNAVSGEFLLDNGHGYTSRSGIAASVLLARLRAPLITTYWLWFEDLPIGWTDADYNDRGFTWTVATTSSVPEDPLPTPEPGTLTLIGVGLAGVARSVRRRRRAASL